MLDDKWHIAVHTHTYELGWRLFVPCTGGMVCHFLQSNGNTNTHVHYFPLSYDFIVITSVGSGSGLCLATGASKSCRCSSSVTLKVNTYDLNVASME
jgi:hypothetical protein